MLRDFLEPHIRTLRQGKAGVELVSKDVEDEFMALSQGLESMSGNTETIASNCHRLAKQGGEEGSPDAVAFYVDLLKETSDVLGQASRRTDEMLEKLLHCDSHVEELIEHEKKIGQAASPVFQARQLLDVEAKNAPEDSASTLTGVAGQIEGLAEKFKVSLEEQFKGLHEKHAILSKAILDIGNELNDHHKRVATDRESLDQSAEEYNSRNDSYQVHSNKLNDLGLALSRSIAKVVIALQFHDITSQRLQHICEVFSEICEHFDKASNEDTGQSFGEMTYFYHRASVLQVRQIESVIEGIQTAENDIREGLLELSGIGQDLLNRSNELQNFRIKEGDTDNNVKMLLDNLFVQSMNICQEVCKVVRESGSNVNVNTVDELESICETIKMLGANLEEQASSGGADQAAVLSRQLVEFSQTLRDAIHELQAGLQHHAEENDLEKHVQELREFIEKEWDVRTEREEQAEKLLEEIDQIRKVSLGDISTLVSEMEDTRNRLLGNMRFTEIIRERVSKLTDPLNEIIAWTGEEQTDEKILGNVQTMVDQLLTKYTMASEKDVHLAEEGKTEDDQPETKDEKDEFGDNFEFF